MTPEIETESEEVEKKEVTEGELEQEFYLESEQMSKFLKELAEQIEEKNEISIETDEWEIPFPFREPIKLEIDFEGYRDEKDLEIEIELKGELTDEEPSVS